MGRFEKKSVRVVFPLHLRIPIQSSGERDPGPEPFYRLYAVIVHIGRDPNHGHYVCYVNSHDHWFLFDDERVDVVKGFDLQHVFGTTKNPKSVGVTETGYILFYQQEKRGSACAPVPPSDTRL